MTFDSLSNEGEYFPSFYLDTILPEQLRRGLVKRWSEQERQGRPTPRQGLRDLTAPYLDARLALAGTAEKYHQVADEAAVAAQQRAAEALKTAGSEPAAFQPTPPAARDTTTPEGEWRAGLAAWHQRLLHALGFTPRPGHLTVHGPTGPVAVPVAHSEPGVVVLTGGFAQNPDEARGDGGANRLPVPLRIASGRTLTRVTDLAAWLLAADHAPRYAVLAFGGVLVLADREHFSHGRHLAVDLDSALPRKGAKSAAAGELDVVAALFGAPSLRPREDGSDDEVSRLVEASRDHSVGVTAGLRSGLQKSVQLIANEVLTLARARDVHPEDLPEWLPDALKHPDELPRLLTTESLRYLYRILFLLYAEARPELDILPMNSEAYAAGYSVARLRDLVVRDTLPSGTRDGHHFHESLDLLFEKVFTGHPVAATRATRAVAPEATEPAGADAPGLTEDDGYEDVRIEALRSSLFDPASIRLVGREVDYPHPTPADGSPRPKPLDLRLRNHVLHQVLRHLTVVEGRGRGGRGGFVSYANLSINHLGAVYEGLMSYTGFIADEPLYEVAKGGDPSGGSWLIRPAQVASGRYPGGGEDSVFVETAVDPDTDLPVPVPNPVGSFVYRLAGRDRQTSASYYTPESLTRATVEQTLRYRLDDSGTVDPKAPEGTTVTAAEVLRWRVCEPALGSGAFLNEAVNQLAELYLRLAQAERGRDIDPDDYRRELQKAKAHIALHNAYGVDLNDTAVELAEISLWLNTMHRGMRAPWYGLHLHRGNSLIGAARKVYSGQTLAQGGWLVAKDAERERPRHIPLGEPIPGRSVHQFLLPSRGWGSIGEKVAVRKPRKNAPADETARTVVDGKAVDWLESDLVDRLTKWRTAIRRKPKGGRKAGVKAAAPAPATPSGPPRPARAATVRERAGQGAFDLGMDIWEQDSLESAPRSAPPEPKPQTTQDPEPLSEAQSADARTQTGRLQALARRVEYLWNLVQLRLQLSEQEIARHVEVWGAEPDAERADAAAPMDRKAVLEALQAEGTPYWRLKQLMDAWCALWFWPLEEIGLLDGTDRFAYFDGDMDLTALRKGYDDRRKVALKTLDDWIEFAEAVVGRVDVETKEGRTAALAEFSGVHDLAELDQKERELDTLMVEATAWEEAANLGDRFPWYETVRRIATDRGFFHWELNFAHIFADGGFDLMVGNPPWVKQEWKEGGVLAEFEPWFELAERPTNEEWAERKADVLTRPEARAAFMEELANHAAVAEYLASVDAYPELVGTQPDLYRAFMLLAWRATGKRGIAGIIHPSTHLTGAKEGLLRKAAYRHLRFHADFTNELLIFANPVGNSSHFSVNVYGRAQEIAFQHMSWLLHPEVLTKSVRHDGSGPLPGVKNGGKWDLRAHRQRIVEVNAARLAEWRELAGEETPPPVEEAKLLFPVTQAEEAAIAALAKWPARLGEMQPRISRGFDEKNDRTAGYFSWTPGEVDGWQDVILQGPMIHVGTPYHKQPPPGGSRSMRDYAAWDHRTMPTDAVPRTNYRRSCAPARYRGGQDQWVDYDRLAQLEADPAAVDAAEREVRASLPDLTEKEQARAARSLLEAASKRPYSEFFRVAWRRQIASNTERSLFAALVPPGPVHVDLMNSMALTDTIETVLAAGFMAALPLDYYLRATSRNDLRIGEASTLPAPTPGHPLAASLLLRTLRLNAQTDAYAPLWDELYWPSWAEDSWAAASVWPDATRPLAEGVGPEWTRDTPLRTEFARRAALVEIDALVAVWLGISAEELVAMYDARFPVLQQYEEKMWFDATGRRIAKAHQQHGYGQPREAWKELSSHPDFPLEAKVPEGYAGPLYRADRRAEMRAAHAEFTRRVAAAG